MSAARITNPSVVEADASPDEAPQRAALRHKMPQPTLDGFRGLAHQGDLREAGKNIVVVSNACVDAPRLHESESDRTHDRPQPG